MLVTTLQATETTVSNTGSITAVNGDRIVAEFREQPSGYPTSVGQPVFWIDPSDSTTYLLNASGGVTNMSSRVGTRYLTSSLDGDWPGWDSGVMNPPTIGTDSEYLGGKAYLDFGNVGSYRALLFNPFTYDEAKGPVNVLRQIGTVIAVWGSSAGGGFLMHGAEGNDIGWHRGESNSNGGKSHFASPVGNGHMQDEAEYGFLRHHGFVTGPCHMGYDGKWEVLSLKGRSNGITARGIGGGDARSFMAWVSSGQKVGEMLIYDRLLTDDEIALVEMYLERKWFSRSRPGWNGDVRLGALKVNDSAANQTVTLDVPAGATLSVGRVEGGSHDGATLVKTGDGALSLNNSASYGGNVKLESGSLAFGELRAVPTVDQLPHDMYVRFDPSDAASLTTAEEDGKAYVANLSSLASAKYKTKTIQARALAASNRPQVLRDELGEGKDVLDFGPLTDATARKYLCFTTDDMSDAAPTLAAQDNVAVVFAVIGAQRGGGNLFDAQGFKRESSYVHTWWTRILYHGICSNPDLNAATHGSLWIDGMRRTPTTDGYDQAGYQVVAIQTPGGSCPTRIGWSSDASYGGGFRLGEMIIYNREMTEREIEDVQAYLSMKWLGKPTPGYAGAPAPTVPDIQSVSAEGDVAIDVAAGRTVRIGSLKVSGRLRKAGDGVLEVNNVTYFGAGNLVVEGGKVNTVAKSDVAAPAELAAKPSVHLDAEDLSTLDITEKDGRKYVYHWGGQDGSLGASTGGNNPPWIADEPAFQLPGKRVIDFGRYGDSWVRMLLDRPLYAIRHVYTVVGLQHGGGNFLGSCTGAPYNMASTIQYHQGLKTLPTGATTYNASIAGLLRDSDDSRGGKGGVYTNGVRVAFAEPVNTNCFMLVEMHSDGPCQAGGICYERSITDRCGGLIIGEMLVYERELTAREKQATRNYLMKKWFGREPQALPEPEPIAPQPRVAGYEVDGTLVETIVADADVTTLSGEGVFVKKGAGTLSLRDVSSFSGTLGVDAGTVCIAGVDAPVAPEFISEGVIYHADATRGITATTNANGVICVSEWASQAGDGVKAVRSGGDAGITSQKIVYDPDLAYMPTVDMDSNNACFMWKDVNGADKNIGGIRSVFWMIGSQRGGGFLLGGGRDANGELWHYWHRGIYYPNYPTLTPAYVGTTNLCELLHGAAQSELRTADWYRNGQPSGPGDHLSGKWDQLSMVLKDGANPVNADGLAFDGRSRKPSDAVCHEYNGHQRLAELICYDRCVTDEERAKIESYLRCKWHQGMHEVAENVTVNVAADATLVLGGAQRFAGLRGTGTVEGDISAMRLVADGAATAWPTVDGTFTIPEGVTVDFSNVDASTLPVEVKILTATSVAGYEFAKNVNCTGVALADGDKVNLRIRNGTLSAVIKPAGSLILVR